MYTPRTGVEWAFLGVTAVQTIGTVVLEIVTLYRYFYWINDEVWQVSGSYVVPVNFGVFVLGNMYMAALAFDALRIRNNLQLFGICVFNIGIVIFAVMRIGQTQETTARLAGNITANGKYLAKPDVAFWTRVQPPLIINAIIVGVCMVASWLLTFRLNREFQWAIYRHISGSISIRRKYLTYQVLLVVMKLEVFFTIAFIVTYGLVDVHFAIPEFPLTMAIIPVLFIQLFMTICFIQHESRSGALAAIVIRLAEIAWLISRILVLYGIPKTRLSNTILKDEMLFFAGCAVVLAITACVNAIVCLLNFKQGLKPLLLHQHKDQYEFSPMHAQARLSSRLELD